MLIRRRTGWTGQKAPRVFLAGLSALALLAAGCSSDGELGADEAATVAEGSEVEFAVDGETWTTSAAGGVIPAGAQVRTEDQEARLTLRGGRVRLSAGAAATLNNDELVLDRGEALVVSAGELASRLEDTTVTGAATYRLASGLGARVGVYSGEIAVRRPAQEGEVPALRELDLTGFRLATRPAPLRYVADDAWDRELLAPAIAFDGEAARLRRGMRPEVGTAPLPAQFYRRFTGRAAVPALAAAATVTNGQAFGPPADVLLMYFVADASGADDVVTAIEHVAALRSAGARWGLVALDLDVLADDVVAGIDQLDNRELALADLAPDARRTAAVLRGARGGGDGSAGGGVTDTAGTSDSGIADVGGTPTGSGRNHDGGGDDGGGGDPTPPPDDDPPGGGGGEDPPSPPPPDDPSAVDRVIDDVNRAVEDPPDGEDFSGGGEQLPEELDAVRDLIDLGD